MMRCCKIKLSFIGNGKSWKLPPNTGDGSYTNLFLTKAGLVTATSGTNPTFTNTIQAEPYGFVLSGDYYGNIAGYQNQYGSFWVRTSHPSDSNRSFDFAFYRANDAPYPGYFDFQVTYGKNIGRAVRCVYFLASTNKRHKNQC